MANRNRLNLLRVVLEQPGISVAEAAANLSMVPAVASKYLRDLNARGLLSVTRRSAGVYYSVEANLSVPYATLLVKALSDVFRETQKPVDVIFWKVTAFTHPRRVAIVRELTCHPARFTELSRRLSISKPALKRHLRKLVNRGFLHEEPGRRGYAVVVSGSPLENILLKLARNNL